MPEISLFHGIRITMNWNEHKSPHFHVQYADNGIMKPQHISFRHCERSEAIQCAENAWKTWIASSLRSSQ